jgi:hypothetical protein
MSSLFPPRLNGSLGRATCLALLMAAFIGTSFLAAKTKVGSGPETAKGGAETISSRSQVLLRFAGRPRMTNLLRFRHSCPDGSTGWLRGSSAGAPEAYNQRYPAACLANRWSPG